MASADSYNEKDEKINFRFSGAVEGIFPSFCALATKLSRQEPLFGLSMEHGT